MGTQRPFLLVDNVFDGVNLYPGATRASSGDAYGTDVRYVADYRRERTLWKAAAAQTLAYVSTDLGAGNTAAVDTIFIDRGSLPSLAGLTVRVTGDDGSGGSAAHVDLTVPALGTVGGDPTSATLAVTEEGAMYGFLGSMAAKRRWLVYVVENAQPIVTGIILGKRIELANYLTSRDEDAGGRSQRTEESPAGYVATDRTYSWRTLQVPLNNIGSSSYDAQIRLARRLCFEKNQPTFIVTNYGVNPERGWLYRYDGQTFSSPQTRVMRSVTMPFRELYPLVA